jgi:hypothetical protein
VGREEIGVSISVKFSHSLKLNFKVLKFLFETGFCYGAWDGLELAIGWS